MAHHLIRRGAVWHWRRRFSQNALVALAKQHISISVRTSEWRIAVIRAAHLDAVFCRVMAMGDRSMGAHSEAQSWTEILAVMAPPGITDRAPEVLTPREKRAILTAIFNQALDNLLRHEILMRQRAADPDGWLEAFDRTLETALRDFDPSPAYDVVDDVLRRRGVRLPAGSDERDDLAFWAVRMMRQAIQRHGERRQGVYREDADLADELVRLEALAAIPRFPSPQGSAHPAFDVLPGGGAANANRHDRQALDAAAPDDADFPDDDDDPEDEEAYEDDEDEDEDDVASPAVSRNDSDDDEHLTLQMRLSDLMPHVVKSNINNTWVPKSARQAEQACRLFISLIGDKKVGAIEPRDASRYQRKLEDLPSLNGKSIYAGLEAIAAIDLRNRIERLSRDPSPAAREEVKKLCARSTQPVDKLLETISKKTINRHVGFMRAVMEWVGIHIEKERKNPFEGLFHKGVKKSGNKRKPRKAWTDENLTTFFSSRLYRPGGGAAIRDGKIIDGTSMQWVPLIAALNAPRSEEILQLETDHIISLEGLPCMCIGEGDSTVKTEGSRRTVPLHPVLIELGFMDFVTALKRHSKGKSVRLFPDVPKGKDGRYTSVFTKRFGTYRRSIGLTEDGKDFHALRLTFNTRLRQRAPKEIGEHFLGHVDDSVNSEHYFGGYAVKNLATHLSTLDYADLILAAVRGQEPAP